jgi:hypothetical protein
MALDDKQIKAVEEASGHSVFGSSSLPRIIDCPASVGMELKAGLRPSSKYAAKGTELHAVTEAALRAEDPEHYVHNTDLSIEDISYVLDAVEYVHKISRKHNPTLLDFIVMTPDENGHYSKSEVDSLVEDGKTVMLLEATGSLASYGIPENYGTGDVIIKSEYRTDVIDHKFGHGVAVYAEKNYQLVSYLGMAVDFQPTPDSDHHLYVHINQPPLSIYDEWRVGWDVLYQMILGDITDAIAKAKSDDPPFGPSTKACRFCNANMGCKERHTKLMNQAKLISQMAKNPCEVPNEKWSAFLESAESLKTAISQVEEHAMSEIQKGNEFPGFKLIGGRSNRKFVDEESAQKYMEKRLGVRARLPGKFISLAQAEKVDKSLKDDEKWAELIYKPTGKPKLVAESSKGTALVYGVKGIMQEIASGKV